MISTSDRRLLRTLGAQCFRLMLDQANLHEFESVAAFGYIVEGATVLPEVVLDFFIDTLLKRRFHCIYLELPHLLSELLGRVNELRQLDRTRTLRPDTLAGIDELARGLLGMSRAEFDALDSERYEARRAAEGVQYCQRREAKEATELDLDPNILEGGRKQSRKAKRQAKLAERLVLEHDANKPKNVIPIAAAKGLQTKRRQKGPYAKS